MSKQKLLRWQLKLPEPLLGLTRMCEVICVNECCGTGAFDVQAQHMVPWVQEHGAARTAEALGQVEDIVYLVSRRRRRFWSDSGEFNMSWVRPRDCLEYFLLWQREITRSLVLAERKVFDPRWMRCNNGNVLALAQTISESGVFERLPILADALEEAGCQEALVLTHCRQPNDHVRSCWVIDLLLNGEGWLATADRASVHES